MGYSWIKLNKDEFGREGARQSFALALILMMFAGVFAFILPAPAAADSWTDTTTENFALGTHENTESVGDNVRLGDMGGGIYYTQGRFTSQAFDAGQVVEDWDNISWNVTTPTLTRQVNDNVGVEPTTLIDGDSRIGVIQTGTYEDTRDNDGVYETIRENNLGVPGTNSYCEAVTVVVSGDNLSSPDKLDADDGDNYRVSAGASVENADYYMTLEPDSLVDGENSRIGVITGGSITDIQTQNNVYENIQESNLGVPTTAQQNAALTIVVSGDNLSTSDKLNVDDGDNYRVDAAAVPSSGDNLVENGDFANNPAASGWENTVTDLGGNEVGRALWDSEGGFVSGHALGRSEDWSIIWYQDFSATANPESATLKFVWRPAVVVIPQEAHIKVKLKSPSAVETTIWTKDYGSSATPSTAWTLQENDVTSIINETGTWRIILQSDLYTDSNSNAEWRWDWDNVTLEIQTGITCALEVQYDSGTFSIPAGATIENVRVRLNFGSDNTATYTLEIRDWQNSEWDILNTGTVASGTEVTWDNILATAPDDYISSNDNIRVRLRTGAIGNDHISKEDYLQFYVNYRPSEYGLRWEHRVTGLPTNGIIYVRIYGYADTGENFGIYTWDGTNDRWVHSGQNLPSGAAAEGWVEYSVSSSYREGDNLSIMYLSADNTDVTPESIHIDYAGVRVTATTYSIGLQHDSEPVSYSGILNNIRVRLNVGSENTGTYTLQIRDWQNSEWDNLETVIINSGTECTFDNTLTVDPGNYISVTDNIRVRLITAASENSHIVNEDYLVYEVNYTPLDYALRWEHRIENVATGHDNYWVRVRGYTSGDSEKVGAYIWDNNASSWEFLDNLTTTEKTITKQIAGSGITQYLRGDNLSIKYEDYDNTDDTQTTLHIDLCIVQAESVYTTEIKFKVATSADNIVWSTNLGPDDTTSTYFTTSPTSLENIGDNRYFRYIAYFSTEDNTITPVLHDVTITYTLPLPAPDAPTLYLPADGTYTNDNTPYFEWTVGANADNHRLLVDNDTDFSSPDDNVLLGATDNTYTISAPGLTDENYSWKVIAINPYGENESSTWTFIIDMIAPSIPAPYLPADGIVTSDNTVYFEWSSIADAENYDLFVDNDSDFSSPEVSVTITDNYYTSSALPGENYFWRVRARDVVNNVSDNSATWTFLIDTIAPSAPALYLPADGIVTSDNTVYFEWSSIADAENYDLFVDNDSDFSSPEVSVTITDNYYTSSALPGENYFWRVRARDVVNNVSDNSATWSFLINVLAPSASTLYLPADGTYTDDNMVYFEWSSVASADNHRLLVDNDADFSSPEENVLLGATDNTYTISAPGLADENYSWKVIAINVFGENESSTWTFVINTITPILPALYLPADGIVTSDNTVYFEWSSVADAETYNLIVAKKPSFDDPHIDVTITDNYYTSSPLTDKSYCWKVMARNAQNKVISTSVTWTFVIDTNAPAAPTLASPENNAVGSALTQTFTWSEPEAGVTYEIQIDNETSFASPYVHEDTGLADNSHAYTFASNGGVYYWRVCAVDVANNQSSWADYFKLSIQVPPSQPTLYLPTDGAITNDNAPTFEWTVGALADNHRLLVDNDPDFSSPEENRIVLDNYYTIADEDSLPDDNYSWKVIAINPYGENESSTWTLLIDTIATEAPMPTLEDNAVENNLTQTFTWSEPEAGVTYIIQIDDEPSFTSPYLHENIGLTDNSYTYTFASDGVYYWRVLAVDAANNQSSWADNLKLTIQVPTSEPTPPGGVIPPPVPEPVPLPPEGALTITISEIKAGQTGSADFRRHAIAVTEVGITTTSDVSGVRVDVVMHEAKPAGLAEVTMPVYIYFDLSTTVDFDYIEGATIKFKVPKPWITQMNVDERMVKLLRYRGGWQRLATEIIGSDSTYFYYEATTPGFSLFAVAGEPMVAPIPTPWDTPTVPSHTQSPSPLYAALFMTAGVAGFAVAYRLARPPRYRVMLKRLKQFAREPVRTRFRHIGMPSEQPATMPSPAEQEALRRLEQIEQEKQLRKRRLWVSLS